MKNAVHRLRQAANRLESEDAERLSSGKDNTVLFPGWDEPFEEMEAGGQAPAGVMIREAARAILAETVAPDDGTRVTRRALAELMRYIADMAE